MWQLNVIRFTHQIVIDHLMSGFYKEECKKTCFAIWIYLRLFLMVCLKQKSFKEVPSLKVQSNLATRNFLVALKLFLNAKSSLSLWSKRQIGHRKWSLIAICSLWNRSLLPSLTVLEIKTFGLGSRTWDVCS